jgi:hypothetical protein
MTWLLQQLARSRFPRAFPGPMVIDRVSTVMIVNVCVIVC